jgi:hypothetical protein
MNRLKARAQEEIVIELSETILTANPKPAAEPPRQATLANTQLSKKSIGNTNNASQRTHINMSRRRHSMKVQASNPPDSLKNIKQPFFKQNED